jgi:hypothetical protein
MKYWKAIISDMADRPGAANKLLKVLRVLLRHAIDMGLIQDNPIPPQTRSRNRQQAAQQHDVPPDRTWRSLHRYWLWQLVQGPLQ